MRNIHTLVIATLAGGLAACSATPTTLDAQAIQDRLAAITAEPTRPLVQSSSGRYVTRVPLRTAAGTHYQSMPLTFTARDLPLGLALDKALETLPRTLRPTLSIGAGVNLDTPITLDVDGTFADLMTALDVQADTWTIVGADTLRLESQLTLGLNIAAFPGQSKFKIGQEEAEGSGGSSGSSGQTNENTNSRLTHSAQYVNMTHEADFWEELERSLDALLGEDGGVTVQSSLSRVTVTGPAPDVRAARDYVDRLNDELSRQVELHIQLVSVTLNDATTMGIDWAAVRTTSQSMARLSGTALAGVYPGTDPLAGLSIHRVAGEWATSEAMIQALRAQGEVSVETFPHLVLLNNQAGELLLNDKTTYLAETTAGVSSNGQLSPGGLVPGVVPGGLSVYVLPRIFEDEVYVHLSATLSTLVGIDTASSGAQSIQIPRTTENVFNQRFRVRHGETRVVAGVTEHTVNRAQDAIPGVGWLGSHHRANERTEIVMLITARIL